MKPISDSPLDRTYDAIVFDCRNTRHADLVPGEPEIEHLCGLLRSAGVEVHQVDEAERSTPGARRAVLRGLMTRGIGPGLVLLIGFDPVGTPSAEDADLGLERCTAVHPDRSQLLQILGEQVRRRSEHRVPDLDEDPRWVITEIDHARDQRVRDALFTEADGRFGSRGAGVIGRVNGSRVYAAGVYTSDPSQRLLPGPSWGHVDSAATHQPTRQVLDLRTGVVRHASLDGSVRTFSFSSITRPGCMALRAEGPLGALRPGSPLALPADDGAGAAPVAPNADPPRTSSALGASGAIGVVGDRRWAGVQDPAGGGITAVAAQTWAHGSRPDSTARLERLAVYGADAWSAPAPESLTQALAAAERDGFDALLREHRRAWAGRWAESAVSIEGDPDIEMGLRFAIFHLLSVATGTGEAAVGARGLSGPGYAGHVFWDADVFVLPALAALEPTAARAMIQYRLNRLPAAMTRASGEGASGARFPWESARDGDEVTPPTYLDHDGEVVAIDTGEHEEHISADVAWAACHYARWSGDEAFLRGPGRPLVIETARYWASKVHVDQDGRAHLLGVVGPDEYHPLVDDNAYTNVMARWNLRAAADLLAAGDPPATDARLAAQFREVAAALVDGFDPASGRYEQFAGFGDLESMRITELADVPIAADLLLGRERVRGAQVVKQADVLMLHHLVPDEVAPGSLAPNLDFYGPRTSHGSSLSPAIHASLLARAGRVNEARDLLHLATRVDLDDLTGTTGGGLHLATMGGVWQALVVGFAGARARGDVLELDPRWPDAWGQVTINFRFRGRRVRIRCRPDWMQVEADRALSIAFAGGHPHVVTSEGRFIRRTDEWEVRR